MSEKLRVYSDDSLDSKTHHELSVCLNLVKTSSDLSDEEKKLNIDKIELKLNGGIIDMRNATILKEIKAGEADPIKVD